MSYSFSVSSHTKDGAKKGLAAKLDEVIVSQPAHAKDKDAALAAAGSFIDLLGDIPEEHELSVSLHGSVGWNHDAPDVLTGAGVGVSAAFKKVEPGMSAGMTDKT